MDPYYVEIVAAPDGAHHIGALKGLIEADPVLAQTVEAWTRPELPRQADLYAMLLVVSPGLATTRELAQRIRHLSRNGFPVIPVVEDLKSYSFRDAPLEEIKAHNTEGLNDPERLVRSVLHHGGLQLFEGGGRVFISHARADGAEVANAIRDSLRAASIGHTVDVHAFAGGDLIQHDIEERVRDADLLVLVDSKGAARSEWVARELDMAESYHVPVIAVTPEATAFHHMVEVPHVRWGPGEEVAPAVLACVRRLLGRQQAFRARVARVVERLATLRRWTLLPAGRRWRLQPGPGPELTIDAVEARPAVQDVMALQELCRPNRGLVVAGVHPIDARVLRGLHRAGAPEVRVTWLSTVAAQIPAQVSPRPLTGKRVFLSAAMPSDPEEVALARRTFAPFIVSLFQSLVELGATLVFGGHPSVSPLIHECVRSLVAPGHGRIELHQPRFWKGAAATVPLAVREGPVFEHVRWHGAGLSPQEDVKALRDGMITRDLDAAVFIGGKTSGYVGQDTGSPPGIIDEHQRFVSACPDRPAFVVGLAGGAARRIPVDGPRILEAINASDDPDLAVALIVAELVGL